MPRMAAVGVETGGGNYISRLHCGTDKWQSWLSCWKFFIHTFASGNLDNWRNENDE